MGRSQVIEGNPGGAFVFDLYGGMGCPSPALNGMSTKTTYLSLFGEESGFASVPGDFDLSGCSVVGV
jgi:hypothetical protein